MRIGKLINRIEQSDRSYCPEVTFTRPRSIYTFINPYSYHIYRKQAELYDSFDGIFVDGFLMCLFIRLLWGRRVQRRSYDMSSMAKEHFGYLNRDHGNRNICFVGAKEQEISGTIEQIAKTYPNIDIPYYRNGYFESPQEREAVIHRIVEAGYSYAVVGMGAPLQERFLRDLRDAGYDGIAFTCGGFLHQTTHKIHYYPAWIDKYNLRAFYRLYKEKGMAKRLYNVLIQFPVLFLYDTIHSKLASL